MPVPCDYRTNRVACACINTIMNNPIRITNTTRNTLIASRVITADTFLSRLKGLLGRKSLEKGEAFLIPRCIAVHTFFMKFSIDIIFIDSDSNVTKTVKNLKPFRISPCFPGTYGAIELPAGTIEQTNTETGDKLSRG